tara:strand:- start:649 stop:1242 length:594 start_codon:yes stop_codon:yes gene_type:complete
MVSVRGQIEDAPLVDISSVRKEYWSKKEILLPSLKKLMPYKSMTRWQKARHAVGLYKPERDAPKVVLRRLSEEEWVSIDERFASLKMEMVKDRVKLSKLAAKSSKGEDLSKDEWSLLHNSHRKALPIYIAMLECMIEKPDVTYEDTEVLVDALDDFDRDTLMSYVNMLTTEKAEVAKKVYDERMQEMNSQMARMVKQ